MSSFLKQVILFFLISAFAASAASTAYAQNPLPIGPSGVFQMPGENCGNPDAPVPKNKCCFYEPFRAGQVPRITPPGLLGDVLNGIMGVFGDLTDRIVGPALNPLNEQVQKTTIPCVGGNPSIPGDLGNKDCICVRPTGAPLEALRPLCKNVSAGEQGACESCLMGGAGGKVGVWTSVGCVYSDLGTFIQDKLLGWGVGLAGGISLLCIMYAAFMMQTSRGNPESIKKAQQLLTSCITGLMLIIFSVFILRLIGVQILRIPGFN